MRSLSAFPCKRPTVQVTTPSSCLSAHAQEAREQSISSRFGAVRRGLLSGGFPTSSHPEHTGKACPNGNNKERRPLYWSKANSPLKAQSGTSVKTLIVVLGFTLQAAAFLCLLTQAPSIPSKAPSSLSLCVTVPHAMPPVLALHPYCHSRVLMQRFSGSVLCSPHSPLRHFAQLPSY